MEFPALTQDGDGGGFVQRQFRECAMQIVDGADGLSLDGDDNVSETEAGLARGSGRYRFHDLDTRFCCELVVAGDPS